MEQALALELVLGLALDMAPAHLGTVSLARGDAARQSAHQPAEELAHIAMVPVRHMLVRHTRVRHTRVLALVLALALQLVDTLFDTQLLALPELHHTVLKPRK